MIDFTITPEQQALRKNAQYFATHVLSTARATYSPLQTQTERFRSLRPIYNQAVQGGLIKGQIPSAMGGTGGSIGDAALLVEEMYAVDPSAALTIFATGLGLTPLIVGGSEELQKRFFKPFLSGEGDPIASLVHSEPGGTANWLEKGGKGLQTTARRDGDDWILNGEKLWTTNSGGWDGRGADVQCVACRCVVDDMPPDLSADPIDSIMVIVVTREDIAANDTSAYQILSDPELAGHMASSGPHSKFTNLRVPHANLLAPPGKGALLIEQSFITSAAMVGAMSVSIMRAAFEAALDFSKTDTRGGANPIISRQSVADLLINIKMRIEASRLMTWKALHCLEHGPGDLKVRAELAFEAKIFGSDNAVRSCVDAMSLVGMSSYDKNRPFSRLLNDATCLPLFDGGNIGIRRRQIEKIFQSPDYQPWATTYEEP